jgi:hypothetical protein
MELKNLILLTNQSLPTSTRQVSPRQQGPLVPLIPPVRPVPVPRSERKSAPLLSKTRVSKKRKTPERVESDGKHDEETEEEDKEEHKEERKEKKRKTKNSKGKNKKDAEKEDEYFRRLVGDVLYSGVDFKNGAFWGIGMDLEDATSVIVLFCDPFFHFADQLLKDNGEENKSLVQKKFYEYLKEYFGAESQLNVKIEEYEFANDYSPMTLSRIATEKKKLSANADKKMIFVSPDVLKEFVDNYLATWSKEERRRFTNPKNILPTLKAMKLRKRQGVPGDKCDQVLEKDANSCLNMDIFMDTLEPLHERKLSLDTLTLLWRGENKNGKKGSKEDGKAKEKKVSGETSSDETMETGETEETGETDEASETGEAEEEMDESNESNESEETGEADEEAEESEETKDESREKGEASETSETSKNETTKGPTGKRGGGKGGKSLRKVNSVTEANDTSDTSDTRETNETSRTQVDTQVDTQVET